jgi:hypothetical protein
LLRTNVGGEELEKALSRAVAGGGDLGGDEGVGVREGERIVQRRYGMGKIRRAATPS